MHSDGTPSSMSNPLYACLITLDIQGKWLHSIVETLNRMVGTFYVLNITTVVSDFKLCAMVYWAELSLFNQPQLPHVMHSPGLFESCNNNVGFHCLGWFISIFKAFVLKSWRCFLSWMVQTGQYLFLIPPSGNFLVAAPKITTKPNLALYECLCALLLQPPSTTTVIAGCILWWYCPLPLASFLFSASRQ